MTFYVSRKLGHLYLYMYIFLKNKKLIKKLYRIILFFVGFLAKGGGERRFPSSETLNKDEASVLLSLQQPHFFPCIFTLESFICLLLVYGHDGGKMGKTRCSRATEFNGGSRAVSEMRVYRLMCTARRALRAAPGASSQTDLHNL